MWREKTNQQKPATENRMHHHSCSNPLRAKYDSECRSCSRLIFLLVNIFMCMVISDSVHLDILAHFHVYKQTLNSQTLLAE